MTVPSDRYTWGLLVLDLAAKGCTVVSYAGAISIERRMGDGRVLHTPIKGREHDTVHDVTLDRVLYDLELDPNDFYE